MNNIPDNTKLIEAIKQFKAVRTVIFQEEFYKAVVATRFFVPVAVEKSDSKEKKGKYCAVTTSNGLKLISVFSSKEELEKCYGDRDDVIGVLHDFPTLRNLIVNEKSGLDGLVIDAQGENIAILREERLPRE